MSSLAHKYQQQPKHTSYEQQEKPRKPHRRSRFTKGEKALFILYVLIALLFITIIIANQARIYSTERDIFVLGLQISEQTQIKEALELQAIELSAPDRILHIATEELGMTLDDNKVKVVQN